MSTASSTNLTMRYFGDLEDGDFLTLPEVAEILRVPVNTIRWWRQLGTGPRFFKIGRRLVLTVGDLRQWIEDQKAAARSAP